jgi:hypothetical protein
LPNILIKEKIMETNTIIYTEEQVRISVDQNDEGVWLSLQARGASMYAVLTRAEAEQMLAGLQAILAIEVTV